MEQHDARFTVAPRRERNRAAGRRALAAQPAGWRLRERRDLLASTALGASTVLLLAFPVAAQPPATARPQGGNVVAGAASISQTAARTDVTQASQRAAIDWRSFDVGSGHTVAYQQPNASSVILNRVTGPDPSQIAGRIQANGQVVIVNGSGVVFHAGSQVDAQSLVVSAANVTNQNFMAGKMVFDQPGKPGARVSNAGSITVGATGLAALVAPQVANSGTITAKMGHVVLAGAEAHTIDLYGDGLMSVDVTRQVTRAPNGATALVTNTGVIQADGGTIQLSARAADGIVQNLVSAGGRLQANSAGGKPGTIVVSAVGGSITVEGTVQADGRAPGAHGGTVVLAATDTVGVGAGARVSASGQGGGGTVAVGTTAARAQVQGGGVPGDAARAVLVAARATISADGRGAGGGGQVALLSTQRTVAGGRLTARGGRRGGNGGAVEVSSAGQVGVTGTVDTTAPAGKTGVLTLDPANLMIGGPGPADPGTFPDNTTLPGSLGAPSVITAATFNNFASDVNLEASHSIQLVGGIPLAPGGGTHAVTLSAGSLNPDGVTTFAGTLTVLAPLSGTSVTLNGYTLNINAAVTAGVGLMLNAGTAAGSAVNVSAAVRGGASALLSGGAVNIGANVSTGGTLTLAGGSVTQSGSSVVTAGTLAGTLSGPVSLTGANQVGSVGPLTAVNQAITLTNAGNLTLAGDVNAGPAGSIQITTTPVAGQAGDVTQAAGILTAGTLGGSVSGSASLAQPNQVTSLGNFSAGGNLTLATASPLTVPVLSSVTGGNVFLATYGGAPITVSGRVQAGATDATTGNVTINGGGVAVAGQVLAGRYAALDGGSNGVTVVAGGTVAAGLAASGPVPGAIVVGSHLTVDGGTVASDTIKAQSGVTQTGGTLSATTALDLGTTPLQFNGGTLVAGTGAVSITANGLGTPDSIKGGDVSIFAGPGLFSTTGTLSASGNIAVTAPGGFIQQGGSTTTRSDRGLFVFSGGAITKTAAGAITTGLLSGTAAGPVTLAGADGIAALGDLSAANQSITLSKAGSLVLAGNVSTGAAGTVQLTTTASGTQAGDVLQTGGTLVAGTLSGSAAGSVSLDKPGNLVATLGTFAAGGTFSLTANSSVAIPAFAAVSGTNVSLNTTGGLGATVTVNGAVGARAVDGGTGNVSLLSNAGVTVNGQVGAERSAALGGGTGGVTVGPTGIVAAGRQGAAPVAGTISIGGPLTLNAGTLTSDVIRALGGVTQTGGLLSATTTLDLGASSLQFNGGTVIGGSSTVGVVTGGVGAADSLTAGTLLVQGTAPQFVSLGTLTASGGVTVSTPGDFSQQGGRITAGGNVAVIANPVGGSAAGLITQAALGPDGAVPVIAAGGNVVLNGTGAGSATLAGTLAAAGTLAVSEPNAAVQLQAGLLGGTGAGAAAGPAAVQVAGQTINLARSFTTGTLTLNSAGATYQTAPVTAAVLQGSAGYAQGGTPGAGAPAASDVTLDNPGNRIAALGNYQVGGSLALASAGNLGVDGTVAAAGRTLALTAPGITISTDPAASLQFGIVGAGGVAPLAPAAGAASLVLLRTDRLDLGGGGAKVVAPGGTVAIAGLVPGEAITLSQALDTTTPGLQIRASSLSGIRVLATGPGAAGPQEVRLGSLDASSPGGERAANIAINAPVDLTASAGTLRLLSNGGIQEGSNGAILIGSPGTPGQVAGQAGGFVALNNAGVPGSPSNAFDVLGAFSAGTGLVVADSAGANAGRGGLTVGGAVTTASGPLALASAGTGGSGAVGGTIQLAPGAALDAGAGTLTLTALNGNGAAAAITQDATSLIRAGTLTGSAVTNSAGGAYGVALDKPGANNVGTLGQFTVAGPTPSAAGAFRLDATGGDGLSRLVVAGPVTAGAVSITGRSVAVPGAAGTAPGGSVGGSTIVLNATVGNVSSAGTIGAQTSVQLNGQFQAQVSDGVVSAPSVGVAGGANGGGGLGILGGQVFGNTVTVSGGPVAMIGGTLHANTLATDASGTASVGFSNGDLYAGNSLSVSLAPVTAGSVTTLGNLAGTAGALSTTTAFRAQGDAGITAAGDVQLGGLLAAGGNVTVTAAGGIGLDPAGQVAAGGTLRLQGGGGGLRTMAGSLSGAQVQVIEPGADVSFTPSALLGAAAPAIGALVNTFHAPGLDSNVASSTFSAASGTAAARPAALRVDGATVSLGTVAADQVELHSAGNTVAQAQATVTATTLTGTAGYAASGLDAAGLPLYPTANGGAGAGSATFAGANLVQRLGGYQTLSGFTFNDGPGAASLTVAGNVLSGVAPGSVTAPVAGAAPVNITLQGPGATLAIGDAASAGTLAGGTVTLATSGPVTEPLGGRIVATELDVSSASLSLLGSNSIATLGTLNTPGGLTLNAPGSALTLTNPVNAGSGAVTLNVGSLQQTPNGKITAATLTGSTTGSADLGAASNAVSSLGDFTAAGGFNLNDGGVALRIAGKLNAAGANVNLNAGSLLETGPGSITAGSLTGSTNAAANLGGGVNAIGAIGLVNPGGGAAGFQSGGAFTLNNGPTALTLNGPLSATGNAVSLQAGSLSQTAAGTLAADQLLLNVTGTTNLTAAPNAVRNLGAIAGTADFGLNDGATALTLNGPVSIGGGTLTLQAGSLAQLAGSTITAGRLQGGTTGATNLGAVVNQVGSLGPFTSGGDFALNNGSNGLVLTGTLNAGSNQVSLTTGQLGQTAAGAVTAGTLTGSVNGSATLGAAVNAVQGLGAFSARGAFVLNDGPGLIVTGRLNALGNQVILSAASLSQTAGGAITAASLGGAVAGGTDLSAATNSVGTLGNFSGGGDLRFNNGAQALVLGNVTVGPNTLLLTAGSLSQSFSTSVTAGTLGGATTGTAALTGLTNAVSQLGAFTTGGDFKLVNTPNLTVTGQVRSGPGAITLVNGGSLTLLGGGGLTGGTVSLQTPGSVAERGGTITAGNLTVAASQLSAGSAANAIQVLDAVSAPNGVLLVNGQSLALLGTVRADNGPVTVQAAGDLTVNSAVSSGASLQLQSAGQLTLAPGSTASGATVTLSAAGAATLAGTVQTGGALTAGADGLQVLGQLSGGAVSLNAGAGGLSVTQAATVSGSSVAATAGGAATVDGQVSAPGAVTVASNGLSVTGTVSSTGAGVGLNSGNGDTLLSGMVSAAGPVTVRTGGAAALSGRAVAGSSLSVSAGSTASLSGNETAQVLTVAAPAIRLDGGTVTVGGAAVPTGTLQSALPAVDTATHGAFFQAGAAFTQTGTTTFALQPGGSGNTVRVSLANGGTVTLGTLLAPSSTLILDLGTGSATGGRISVGSLYLSYTPGSGGSADVLADIGGLSGTGAASAATVFPFANASYRINSCALASVNCVILTPQTVPVGNPLKTLNLSFFREQDDDDQLTLPNVSDQGL